MTRNSDLVTKSESMIDIKLDNDAVTNSGPDAADIEKRTGKKLQKKYIKFTRERNRFRLGDNDVVLSHEKFTKYNTNLSDKKPKLDKPKKFKKSDRVKKKIKKIRHKRKLRGSLNH